MKRLLRKVFGRRWTPSELILFLASVLAVVSIGFTTEYSFQNHAILTEHSSELAKIHSLYQKDIALNKTLRHDLNVVGQYASALQTEVGENHDVSRADQAAICAAIPGCVLPPASSP